MKFEKSERGHGNKFYRQLYAVWNHMKNRCYNPENKSYKNYGGDGVTTDPKWMTFDGFAEDADHIDGWNKEKFIQHNLVLDKDYKVIGNKVYSKDTCTWIDPITNVQWRPHLMHQIVIQDPKGNRYYEHNQSECIRKYPLNKQNMRQLLYNQLAVAKNGWQAKYLEDEKDIIPYDKLYRHIMVYTPKGKLIECISKRDVAEKFNIPIEAIWKYMGPQNRAKSIRGYQLWYKDDFSEDKIIPIDNLYIPHGTIVGVKIYLATGELYFSGTLEKASELLNCKVKAVKNNIYESRKGRRTRDNMKFIAIYK